METPQSIGGVGAVGPGAAAALVLALACTLAGVAGLRAAWARRGGGGRLAAAWALLAASPLGWRLTGAAWDKAAGLAVLATGVAGLVALGLSIDPARRGAGPRRREPREVEPPPVSGPRWRAWAHAVCAGPLGLAAALGCAALLALHGPGDAADRLVGAGFLMPTLWAAAGVWATTDDRVGRVALALAAVAVASFAGARA